MHPEKWLEYVKILHVHGIVGGSSLFTFWDLKFEHMVTLENFEDMHHGIQIYYMALYQ